MIRSDRRRARRWLPVLVLSAVGAAACGRDPAVESMTARQRTIRIQMRDIAFAPNTVTVRAGQTVRFEFRNVGQLEHEALIGTAAVQNDHEREVEAAASRPQPPATTGSTTTTMASMEGMGGMAETPGSTTTTTTMAGMGGMGMGMGGMGSDAIVLKPGMSGSLTRTFRATDDGILIGCHEPGHYRAGMRITVRVLPSLGL